MACSTINNKSSTSSMSSSTREFGRQTERQLYSWQFEPINKHLIIIIIILLISIVQLMIFHSIEATTINDPIPWWLLLLAACKSLVCCNNAFIAYGDMFCGAPFSFWLLSVWSIWPCLGVFSLPLCRSGLGIVTSQPAGTLSRTFQAPRKSIHVPKMQNDNLLREPTKPASKPSSPASS